MAGVGDDYVAPWRRGCQSLGQTAAPAFNAHLVQLKPRTGQRPVVLDMAVEALAKRPRRLPSGHSLLR